MKISIVIDTDKNDKPTVEVVEDAPQEEPVSTEIPLSDYVPDLSKPVRMRVVEDDDQTIITEEDDTETKVSKDKKR